MPGFKGSMSLPSIYKKPIIKPKRPPSSYILWLNEYRNQLKREFPDYGPMEISKVAGERWHQLQDKSEWQNESERLWKIYNRRIKRQNPKKPNQIKRPLTAYMLWFTTNRSEIIRCNPDVKGREVAVVAGHIWRHSVNQKKWKRLATINKRNYEKKIKRQAEALKNNILGRFKKTKKQRKIKVAAQ